MKTFSDKIEELSSPLNLDLFFCYSDEMARDVTAIENALFRFGAEFKGSINLNFAKWRDYGMIDNHSSEKQIQDFFNQEILKRDYVVFLFHNSFGRNTMIEWNLCRNNPNKTPKILLGIKHNKNSRLSVCDVRNILNSGNYIIDVQYARVSRFANAIKREILRRLNERMREVRMFLMNPKEWNLSYKQVQDLEKMQERIGHVIAKTQSRVVVSANNSLAGVCSVGMRELGLAKVKMKPMKALVRNVKGK